METQEKVITHSSVELAWRASKWCIILLIISCVGSFVIFCILSQWRQASDSSSKELLYVDVVFRHGERTPVAPYPNDPHKNETLFPYGWGQLTNEGQLDLYELGTFLRKRYSSFLGDIYVPDVVAAHTTGSPRTDASLQIVLAGMFPPENTPMEWNSDLNWQPVVIESESLDENTLKARGWFSTSHINILFVHKPCPRVAEAVDEVLQLPEVRKMFDDNKEMLEGLAKLSGMPMKRPDDVLFVHNALHLESEFGLKLPAWTKDYFPDKTQNLTDFSFIYPVYTDELKRLKAGPFVKHMTTMFERKQNSTLKELKMSLYSVHGKSLVAILHSMNVWKSEFPAAGLVAMFELVRDKNTDEIGIQIYMRKHFYSHAVPVTLPNCQHFCRWDKFIGIVQKLIPDDYDALCMVRNNSIPAQS